MLNKIYARRNYLLKRAQIVLKQLLISGVLRYHRTESTYTGLPAYESHMPALQAPNQHIIKPLCKHLKQEESLDIKYITKTVVYVRGSSRSAVARADDICAEAEISSIAGDEVGFEEQERGAERARVEGPVSGALPPPSLLHNLKKESKIG